ncbi:MAG: Fe-S cluster assembly ATPase SufC [Thermoleophilia bacterium]|nr:Fe-S cluster assembly ATPase SufC [Thermoleophilia bacterium]
MADLIIKNLHVSVEGTEILSGIDLTVRAGEIHALMGPNGSGKSTLSYALMGHPSYEVTQGSVEFGGQNLLEMAVDERARLGLFLAFQYPQAVPGVSVTNFLRMAINAHRGVRGDGRNDDPDAPKPIKIPEFRKVLEEAMDLLKVDRDLIRRYLNDGFSGGEKKRVEILQMALLNPTIAILDETDSGLDIDALRIVAEGVQKLVTERGMGALVITHYQRILNYIEPEFVHILVDGKIVTSGGFDLAKRLELEGYAPVLESYGIEAPARVGAGELAGAKH